MTAASLPIASPHLQSPAFVQTQEAALEVLALATTALELGDRLAGAPPTEAGPARQGAPDQLQWQQEQQQALLLGVAGTAHALAGDPLRLLRTVRSPLLAALLGGLGAAVPLAEDAQVGAA